jgi:hypothetical protein
VYIVFARLDPLSSVLCKRGFNSKLLTSLFKKADPLGLDSFLGIGFANMFLYINFMCAGPVEVFVSQYSANQGTPEQTFHLH